MDDNAIHQWLIDCFGQIQGEIAWNQLSQLPQEVRDQLMHQDSSKLPKPDDVRALMQAFSGGGLNSVNDMEHTIEQGPVNVKLATSIALQQANADGSEQSVNAKDAQAVRQAMSEANLWLDSVCDVAPAKGEPQVLTRAGWVEATLGAWARFAAPVAQSMNDALAAVITDRLGSEFGGEIAGIFAGPVPIPIPEGMKDPGKLIRLLGNTSFSMQLGHAAGDLSQSVRGSFDQGVALLDNTAGAIIAQNAVAYARSLGIDEHEVLAFIALQELAHARLFAAVPWLMPRFEALIGKYARGVDIDLDAMEEQLRDAGAMDPESISAAVNLSNVGISDSPEQQEALKGLETMLALVEGWVDAVTSRAGMAHLEHIEQLREMLRRERAVGGPAERTFESLIGLQLRPKRIREAATLWERIGTEEGTKARDAMWSHPDLLPTLPTEACEHPAQGAGNTADAADKTNRQDAREPVDWDAELSKLLNDEDGSKAADGNAEGATAMPETAESPESPARPDTSNPPESAGSPNAPTAGGSPQDGSSDDNSSDSDPAPDSPDSPDGNPPTNRR